MPVIRKDLEIGFLKGVARAGEGGLDISSASGFQQALLDNIEQHMNAKESSHTGPPPLWNPRAVKHIAENLTTFEIAWRNDPNPAQLDPVKHIVPYIDAFVLCGNCWSHV